jgi:hypothetical protein
MFSFLLSHIWYASKVESFIYDSINFVELSSLVYIILIEDSDEKSVKNA